MLTDFQRQLREKYLQTPTTHAPEPWERVTDPLISIGGLIGVGFAPHPETRRDLLLVISSDGRGLFDPATGEKLDRDRDPDWSTPDNPELTCPGIGPLAGTSIRISGLFGGGLNTTSGDGWTVSVVSPDWPHHRILLSTDGGLNRGPAEVNWWHIFHADYSELRAAGFSPSGRTLAVATSSDITLWNRPDVYQPARHFRTHV
ncbi:hypothetical protein ABH935_009322 [Catenulispora sp. GAS73]|uniref:hypothetical protein n=1 Tax=Catenulispora sp. GAS73 TaxID=3156269 RepID=UPI003519074D